MSEAEVAAKVRAALDRARDVLLTDRVMNYGDEYEPIDATETKFIIEELNLIEAALPREPEAPPTRCTYEIRPMIFCSLGYVHDGPHRFDSLIEKMLAEDRLPGTPPKRSP